MPESRRDATAGAKTIRHRIELFAEQERQLNLRIQWANSECTREFQGREWSVAELLDRRAEVDRRATITEKMMAASCNDPGRFGSSKAQAKRHLKATELLPNLKQVWDDLLELNVAVRLATTASRPSATLDPPPLN